MAQNAGSPHTANPSPFLTRPPPSWSMAVSTQDTVTPTVSGADTQTPIPFPSDGQPADGISTQYPLWNTPMTAPNPNVASLPRMNRRSGFNSPQKHSDTPEFYDECDRLYAFMATAKQNVLHRCVRELWEKTLLGSDYHSSFIFNCSLNSPGATWLPSTISKFGKKLACETAEQIVDHWNTQIIDKVKDKLIQKMSNEVMDEIIALRFKTIPSRELLNMLARSERLGYTINDVLDETEVDQNDLDLGAESPNQDLSTQTGQNLDTVMSDSGPSAPVSQMANSSETLVDRTSPAVATDGALTNKKKTTQKTSQGPNLGAPKLGPKKTTNEHTIGNNTIEEGEIDELAFLSASSVPNDLDEPIIYFKQAEDIRARFDVAHKCKRCKSLFPLEETYKFHLKKKLCLRKFDAKRTLGCVFCGSTFAGPTAMVYHATNHVCGDFTKLGQTPDSPNGVLLPGWDYVPPCVALDEKQDANIRKYLFDREKKLDENGELKKKTPTGYKHKTKRKPPTKRVDTASEPKSPPRPNGKKQVARRRTMAEIEATTIPIPSLEFLAKHHGDPTAHLTPEQIDSLNKEIAEVDLKYGLRMAVARRKGDADAVRKLTNTMFNRRSMIRRRYGVRMRSGFTYRVAEAVDEDKKKKRKWDPEAVYGSTVEDSQMQSDILKAIGMDGDGEGDDDLEDGEIREGESSDDEPLSRRRDGQSSKAAQETTKLATSSTAKATSSVNAKGKQKAQESIDISSEDDEDSDEGPRLPASKRRKSVAGV